MVPHGNKAGGDKITHVTRDGDRGTLGFLGEGDNTGNGRVSLEDSDSLLVVAMSYRHQIKLERGASVSIGRDEAEQGRKGKIECREGVDPNGGKRKARSAHVSLAGCNGKQPRDDSTHLDHFAKRGDLWLF